MNLEKLFQIQAELDEKIVSTKGLEERDVLNEKILALQVELGECANEWRGFKFWSNNQMPRTKHSRGATDFTGAPVIEYYNPLLEEYVDCLHFILSIGNEIANPLDKLDINHKKFEHRDILWHFQSLMSTFADLWAYGDTDESYGSIIKLFLDLGELLGFTYNQIEQAYLEKNQVNHVRQQTGY
jgi:dimeric dUTPase (all-alpha-NTP-PPase superfamily)